MHPVVQHVRWVHRSGAFDLSAPVVMGVLNITPDSFSDGGLHLDPEAAVDRVAAMVNEGVDLVDIGGESTRPGSRSPDPAVEISRVVPVIRAIRSRWDLPVSVDTRRAEVARAALDAGADIVNDVSALGDPEMAGVISRAGAGVVLMHMRGTPELMQNDPRYIDVAGEVTAELRERLALALDAGINRERIAVDPGIGFAKTFDHNLELIARLKELSVLGQPMVLGASRKAFLGALIGGAPPEERGVATVAACVVGFLNGAGIFRVHDVKMVREALQVAAAIRGAGISAG
ncbi:MAG: dihydropteroate synthase [Gemmatimonadota bacterium]|jgi:dihydropteroate synthase|nr:dihydropteroate synthase [Gemmatimonadota bacterium]